MRLTPGTLGALMALAFTVPVSASPCPANVTEVVLKAHVGAVVNACKQETEYGKVQYEVKITAKDGKRMELDVDPGGTILLTEEHIELAAVPSSVMTAFAAKFPGAKATRAEKQTEADGKVTYEIAFGEGAARKEATFTADGGAVEEEGGED
jgi:hypothetical protein